MEIGSTWKALWMKLQDNCKTTKEAKERGGGKRFTK
jgi:hypothetical protein